MSKKKRNLMPKVEELALDSCLMVDPGYQEEDGAVKRRVAGV